MCIHSSNDHWQPEAKTEQAGMAQWIEHRTCGFKSMQEQRKNFLLQGQLSVLLFRYPFHPIITAAARETAWSFCQSTDGGLQIMYMHLTYVDLHKAMVHGCMHTLNIASRHLLKERYRKSVLGVWVVWCVLNAPRQQQFYVAPTMSAL